MAPPTDDEIAARLRQLLSDGDLPVQKLCGSVKVSIRRIKSVVRARPAEFGMYRVKSSSIVKCYAAAGQQDHASSQPRSNGTHGSSNNTRSVYCRTCNLHFESADKLEGHKGGARHKVTLLAEQLRQSGSFHANMQGLQVSEFQEVPALQLGETKVLSILVENVGSVSHDLQSIYQMRALPDVQVLTDVGPLGVSIPPGHQLDVMVQVKPSSYGLICTMLVLDFGFVIARQLSVECDPFGPDAGLPDISAKGPYQQRRFNRKMLPVTPPGFVPGEKEKRPKMPWQHPPRQHPVPARLRAMVSQGSAKELQAELDKFKGPAADLRSHLDKMHLLLHLEELQQEVDVRSYDMPSAELERSGTFLALRVPGLAEARPSVLRGDALYVCRADGSDGSKEWQGIVHVVRQEEVLLRFNRIFHKKFIVGLRFNVRFAIKRTGFVFMHEALDVARGGAAAGLRQELLLPPPDARSVPGTPLEVSRWCNANVGSNPEQAHAVRCILTGTSGQLPFILWGPPGTGKTSTLVEAAAQVLRVRPMARLLLVAPSNLATDLLVQRLLAAGRPKSEMLRVCAFARPKEDLLPGLEEISNWDERSNAFQLPPLQQLMAPRTRVVAVTALMAAKLHALGVHAGYFSHMLMDEAGHAEEPLALCALAGLAGPDTSVVLAGDPKQLGPVVHSKLARDAGLGLSLLERLTSLPPYASVVDDDDSSSSSAYGLIVKLVRNYRSHPSLLSLPSRLFYRGDLLACADPEITDTLLHWDGLPNKQFAALFHSVVGKDERELNSPSWFNILEAKLVLQYITTLTSMRRNRVSPGQIGVVTPYRRQVQRIQRLLDAKGFRSVQVGSVEQLQGQEKRVIIISTVRSDPSFLEHDFKHKLGFVGNAKRFNVAITRAQALMIVIGNPAVLMHDKHWLALLLSCQAHGSVTGQQMPDLSEAAAAAAEEEAEAAAAAAGGGAGASSRGQAGNGSSANGTSRANGTHRPNGTSDSLQQQLVQLERLMASMTLSRAEADAEAQRQLLEDTLGFSGLTEEAGGGFVRHE